MKEWRDKNFGKHPQDPEYDSAYNAEEDRERFDAEQTLKEMQKEGN